MLSRIKILLCLLLSLPAGVTAQSLPSDDTERDVRENPVITADFSEQLTSIPAFIKLDRNHIDYNGADWSRIRQRFAERDTVPVSIVHVGDSHLQADYSTGLTRRLFQGAYGNRGRGLISPLRLAGTNEPRDYSIKSSGRWRSSKLMKPSSLVPVGFTGVGISPLSAETDLTVSTLSRTGEGDPFDLVVLYYSGNLAVERVSIRGKDVAELDEAEDEPGQILVMLPEPTSEVTLGIKAGSDAAVYGVSLINSVSGGIEYNVIGNNGATYSSYNNLENFSTGVSSLVPDLVVVSLGANEAFGKTTAEGMYEAIDVLVSNIKRSCPEADILLTTPMECQRRKLTRKGRRSRVYTVNDKIATMREAILRYGREKGIATYDWYSVAGGAGASSQWVNDGLMAKDRIHHSYLGYLLNGQLFFDALNRAIQQ